MDAELDNPLADVDNSNLAQLNFNSDVSSVFGNSDTNTELELLNSSSNDIFVPTDDSSPPALTSLVHEPFFCDTMVQSRNNDEITISPQLQVRSSKPSSCPSSASPTIQSPTGEMVIPGTTDDDDDDFNINTLLENISIPSLFQDDNEICPPTRFGLSNIPVCDNPAFSPEGPLLGEDWVTLYDVYACMLTFFLSPSEI